MSSMCCVCKIHSVMNMEQKLKIVIDGEIGAGKTTIVNSLKDRLTKINYNVAVGPEPIELWVKTDILDRYYKAKAHHRKNMLHVNFKHSQLQQDSPRQWQLLMDILLLILLC